MSYIEKVNEVLNQTLPTNKNWLKSESIPCNQYERINFLIEYSGINSATPPFNGGLVYCVEWSVNNVDWNRMSEVQVPVITQGSDITGITQICQIEYLATSLAPQLFMTPTFRIAGNFVRFSVRESENLTQPGEIIVKYYLSGANT